MCSAVAKHIPAAPPPATREGVILIAKAGHRAGVFSARCSFSLRAACTRSAPARFVCLGALKPTRAQKVCGGHKFEIAKSPSQLFCKFLTRRDEISACLGQGSAAVHGCALYTYISLQ